MNRVMWVWLVAATTLAATSTIQAQAPTATGSSEAQAADATSDAQAAGASRATQAAGDAKPYTVECGPDPEEERASLCLVDRGTYVGWRTFHAICHTCHAQDAVGSTFAPDLLERMRQIDKAAFMTAMNDGFEGQMHRRRTGVQRNGMFSTHCLGKGGFKRFRFRPGGHPAGFQSLGNFL